MSLGSVSVPSYSMVVGELHCVVAFGTIVLRIAICLLGSRLVCSICSVNAFVLLVLFLFLVCFCMFYVCVCSLLSDAVFVVHEVCVVL